MYTITVITHVDDYHAQSTRNVDTLDEVTDTIEYLRNVWAGSPDITVRVNQNTVHSYTIRVEN